MRVRGVDSRYIVAVDPLADLLELSRVRGALVANVRARAPWGLALPVGPGASFHAVTAGTAWLRVEGMAPVQLMPGDLLLFPNGSEHRLSSELDTPCRPFDRALKQELMTATGDLELGDAGATTSFVCAAYDYDLELAEPLVSLLPSLLHVPADMVSGREISVLVELLAAQGLKHTSDAVGTIAREVGYTSEYAFNRAFSRHRGQPPGRYRRLARAA